MLQRVLLRGRLVGSRGGVSGVVGVTSRRCLARPLATYDGKMPEKHDGEIFIKTPYIGEGYFTAEMGELFEWCVDEGEDVSVDQTVAVIETHKAAIDVRTPVSGKVGRKLCDVGAEVYEVQPILTIIGTSTPRVRYKVSSAEK